MSASIYPIGLSDAKPATEEEREYTEPAVNQAVYCSGVAKASVRDGAVHLAFFVDQDSLYGLESVVNLRIIMAASAWPEVRRKIDNAMAAFLRSLDG